MAEDLTVNKTTLPELFSLWSEYGDSWKWINPFITPPWLKAWWGHFAGENELMLLLVLEGTQPLGIAPLMVENGIGRFIGSIDLCDTGDFVAAPGAHDTFSRKILHFLEEESICRLSLEQVRPDSLVFNSFIPAARAEGWRVSIVPQAASLEMDLPVSWEEYLQRLAGKQRHEVRRKLRRVHDAGILGQRVARRTVEATEAMDSFLYLFRESRQDKREFMTELREGFFRSLATELSQFGMLSLCTFTVDELPAAAVFCIESGKTTYLYNNGYSPKFRTISLGMVSKIETIRSSIEAGQRVYDFLGGSEKYKYQLGGAEVPLLKCLIELGT